MPECPGPSKSKRGNAELRESGKRIQQRSSIFVTTGRGTPSVGLTIISLPERPGNPANQRVTGLCRKRGEGIRPSNSMNTWAITYSVRKITNDRALSLNQRLPRDQQINPGEESPQAVPTAVLPKRASVTLRLNEPLRDAWEEVRFVTGCQSSLKVLGKRGENSKVASRVNAFFKTGH